MHPKAMGSLNSKRVIHAWEYDSRLYSLIPGLIPTSAKGVHELAKKPDGDLQRVCKGWQEFKSNLTTFQTDEIQSFRNIARS